MATKSGDSAITELGTAECWSLLESVSIGRLAVTGLDGAPDVFPLNFTVHNGALYARSAHGAKVLDIATRPAAALEIDGEDDESHWSVVVRGAAARVDHDAEIRESGVLRLGSVNPASKPHVIRLTPATVTGRRFKKGVQTAEDGSGGSAVAREGDAATEPVVTDTTATRSRAERPTPIPHFSPEGDDVPER